MSEAPPPAVKSFGPDSTCTLDTCSIEWSIYGFQPSLAANAAFLSLFILVGVGHAYLGFRWRSWGFMAGMLLGCLSEAIGYVGRIMLWNNPFSFIGFMIQIGEWTLTTIITVIYGYYGRLTK